MLAAVVSFAIATALHTSDQPILAPLTALLVVQLTMYETVAHGWERILSVTAGVSVAAVFAHVVGLTWWSLAPSWLPSRPFWTPLVRPSTPSPPSRPDTTPTHRHWATRSPTT